MRNQVEERLDFEIKIHNHDRTEKENFVEIITDNNQQVLISCRINTSDEKEIDALVTLIQNGIERRIRKAIAIANEKLAEY